MDNYLHWSEKNLADKGYIKNKNGVFEKSTGSTGRVFKKNEQLPKDRIFIFKVDPVAKPRMTQVDKWRKRPVTGKYWAFKDLLRFEANQLKVPDLPGIIKGLIFIVRIPKYRSAKDKIAMDGEPHTVRPDLDNYLKAFQDALCKEDSHIYSIQGELGKYWGPEGRIILKL